MSRIGSLVNGLELYLLNHLTRVNQAAIDSTIRLATNKYVNNPGDNPSAFLQIQNFEHQLSVVNRIKANVDVATTVGAELQLTMDEIRTELTTIHETLTFDEDGSLTQEERDANQAIIDGALDRIRALARTSVGGSRYLDGSRNYSFTGMNLAQIKSINVYSLENDTSISGTVSSAATRASVNYTGPSGNIANTATFNLTGKRGTAIISVTNGEALTAARDRINTESHNTGITASVSGNTMTIRSVDYGADAIVDIDVTSGTFSTSGTTVGSDATVTINGISISSNDIDGNYVSYRDNGVNLTVDLQPGYSGAISSVAISDDYLPKFALSTRMSEQTKLALPGLFPELLGGVSGTLADIYSGGAFDGLGTNTSAALRIVDEAIGQLATIDGRISAFADITVASAGRLMDAFAEELETSLETLNTVDTNAETLILAKNESLAANTAAAISILQQQQNYILNIFRQQAGIN
jgi:flagellin-like hook-associated protein FlgL